MKKPLVISAILGVVAALFVAMYLNALESTYKKGAQKVKVLVAKEYLDQATMPPIAIIAIRRIAISVQYLLSLPVVIESLR